VGAIRAPYRGSYGVPANEHLDLLSAAEQHAYRLMVRMAGDGADDLAVQAGIGAREAAALLEALRDQGLATGGPRNDALPPDVALGEVLLREQQDLEAAWRMVASLTRGVRYRAIY
jgi:hypothetical protein